MKMTSTTLINTTQPSQIALHCTTLHCTALRSTVIASSSVAQFLWFRKIAFLSSPTTPVRTYIHAYVGRIDHLMLQDAVIRLNWFLIFLYRGCHNSKELKDERGGERRRGGEERGGVVMEGGEILVTTKWGGRGVGGIVRSIDKLLRKEKR